MKEKTRSTGFNIVMTIATRFILLFGSFIVSIVLARLLGPEGKGIMTAVLVFPTLIASLADMGIRQSTAYYVGRKQYSLNDIISSISFLWLITTAGSMVSVLLYFYFGPSNHYSWDILIVALLIIPFKLIENYAKGIMLGRNQIGVINFSQIIHLIANYIFVFLFVWILDLNVLGALIAQVGISFTVATYYLIKVIPYGKIRFKPIKPIPRKIFFRGFSFAIVLFIINLNYKVDIMMLDYMVPSSDIGIYSVGVNFAELIWQIPSAVGMVIFSKSTTTVKQMDSVQRATSILRLVMPVMALAAIFIAILAPIVITVLYGNAFSESGNILRIMLPGVVFITISKVLHPELAGRGYPLFSLRVFVVTLILNIVLNLMFIPSFGIYGAAVTSTICYILAGLGFAFMYSKREGIPMKSTFILTKKDMDFVTNQIRNSMKKIKALGERK